MARRIRRDFRKRHLFTNRRIPRRYCCRIGRLSFSQCEYSWGEWWLNAFIVYWWTMYLNRQILIMWNFPKLLGPKQRKYPETCDGFYSRWSIFLRIWFGKPVLGWLFNCSRCHRGNLELQIACAWYVIIFFKNIIMVVERVKQERYVMARLGFFLEDSNENI